MYLKLKKTGTQFSSSKEKVKKKLKRKRRKSEDELDEEDLELIAEGEEEEYRKEKHRRLKKNQREVDEYENEMREDDEGIDDESEEGSFIEDHGRNKKHYGYNQVSENIRSFLFGNEMEQQEGVNENEERAIEQKKKTLQDIFEAEEIEQKFATDEDTKIKMTDIPERLQIKYKNRPTISPNELHMESVWIFDKMKKLKNNPLSEAYRTKIFTALNNLRTNHYEVMFQAFYRKNELMPEIGVNDLWEIYDLDDEWGAFYAEKEQIKKDMLVLENNMKISKSISHLFDNTFDKYHLDYIQDFINYHLSKYVDPNDENNDPEDQKPTYKRPLKRVFAQEAINLRLDQIAKLAGLSPDQLAENLQAVETSGKIIYSPVFVELTPEITIEEYRNTSNPLAIDTLSTMLSLCNYMANDLFYHPCIRNWIRKMYIEKVTISTEPTAKGRKDLDVNNANFVTKRIQRRPIGLFVDDLWLRMMNSENDGLIAIKFLLPWDNEKEDKKDKNELKDEIYARLLGCYIASVTQDSSETQREIIKQWNILRDKVLQIFLFELMYPYLEKMLREELRERSEKYVTKLCAEKFHSLLNISPYFNSETGEDEVEKKRKATMVAVVIDQTSLGKIGVVYADQHGELVDYLILKFFAIQIGERNSNPQIQASFEKDREEFDKFIMKHKPDVIAISANCLEAKRVKQMIVDYKDSELATRHKNGEKINIPWITYGDNIVPQLFAKTAKSEKEFRDYPLIIKEAISLARLMQNPMVEVLNLWTYKLEENPVFYIPFHPMQSSINKGLLKKEYERVAIEMVNNVGVDINEVIAHRHGTNQLQFLCGLGPRKVANLLDSFNKSNSLTHGVLIFRSELTVTRIFEKVVYANVAGFLKISLQYENLKHEVLDSTRIHPENYLLAKKIARDALDEDAPDNMQDWVPKIMKDALKLRDLDLEDYANYLTSQKGKPNMIYVLRFIEKELTVPFEDPRTGKKELDNKDLFYRLCKENPFVFRPHCFVTVKIIKINQKNLLCKIVENGLIGIIADIFDKNEDLTHNYSENQILRAKVKAINFENVMNGEEQRKKNDLRVELTIKPSEMTVTKAELKEIFPNWESLEKYFKIIEKEDFPQFVEANQKQIRYIPRKINHPKFKNISIALALTYLQDKSVGEFVIRPSSRGTEQLNITWKFFDKVIVHLDVKEGPKNPTTLMASKYYIGKDQFDTLDEIIEKYINKCNQFMKAVSSHSKFKRGDLDLIETELLRDKSEDNRRIPYYFGCFASSPHYIVLCYLLVRNEIIKEYIKVKPGGLFFHNLYFTTLSSLILWFKENFKNQDYQKYLKKVKPPYSELENNNKAMLFNKEENDIFASPGPGLDDSSMRDRSRINESSNFRIKEEKIKDEKIKKEMSNKSNIKCNTCGKFGHSANECYVSKRSAGGFTGSKSHYDKGYNNHRSSSQDKFHYKKSRDNSNMKFKKNENQGWGTMGGDDTWGSGGNEKTEFVSHKHEGHSRGTINF